MIIAIVSDSHDRTDNLAWAIATIKARGIKQAIHLGDYCAPFVVQQLADSGLQWIGVWGNNDGDKLMGMTNAGPNVDIAPSDFREVELAGRALFLTHYPQIARLAALSGQYDAAFHGHTHVAGQELLTPANGDRSEVLLANPGEIYGMRTGLVSFGLYETETNSFELISKPTE